MALSHLTRTKYSWIPDRGCFPVRPERGQGHVRGAAPETRCLRHKGYGVLLCSGGGACSGARDFNQVELAPSWSSSSWSKSMERVELALEFAPGAVIDQVEHDHDEKTEAIHQVNSPPGTTRANQASHELVHRDPAQRQQQRP